MNTMPSFQLTIRVQNNSGFSFIEVLISILVLSIGILGTVKMQLISIQASQQSNFYSTAVELAAEMADKIRSHYRQPGFPNTNPFLNTEFQSNARTPISTNACYDTGCTLVQLADADISEWIQHINTALPHVHAVICRDSAPWNSNTNSLSWNCTSSDANASLVIKLGWEEHNETRLNPPPRLALAVAY